MTFSQLFHSHTKTIAMAAGLLMVSSFISGILGLIRNGLLSWRFGAGETTDIYLAAFRIPDFLYGVLIMGGITAVFLPIFSESLEKNKKEAWEFTSNLLNILLAALAILSVIAFLFAPILIQLVAPGFSLDQRDVAASLTRLMLLSPIFLGISSIFSGVLQYFGKFAAYALAPILYNIGIIIGILFLVPLFGIWGLGLGVVGGALLHLLVQVPAAVKLGFHWEPLFHIQHPLISKVFRLALPRTIAAAGFHINLIVITALASIISTGSITIFNYANDIQHLPIGLIGASFAIAAFPALSRFFAEQNIERFRTAFLHTFRQIAFLVVPVSLMLFLLRAQIVRLIYGAGDKFTWDDTRLTAAVLGIFAFGILFQAFIPFLARTFFSTQNTKTPTIISIATVILNILLAIVFLKIFSSINVFTEVFISFLKLEGIADIRVLALPLALAISGIFQFLLLILFLRKYIRDMLEREMVTSLLKTGISAIILVSVTYVLLQLYGGIFALRTYGEVFWQLVIASFGGGAVYFGVAFFLRSTEMSSIWSVCKKQLYGK